MVTPILLLAAGFCCLSAGAHAAQNKMDQTFGLILIAIGLSVLAYVLIPF